jgi:hypothetical protein
MSLGLGVTGPSCTRPSCLRPTCHWAFPSLGLGLGCASSPLLEKRNETASADGL